MHQLIYIVLVLKTLAMHRSWIYFYCRVSALFFFSLSAKQYSSAEVAPQYATRKGRVLGLLWYLPTSKTILTDLKLVT